MTGTNPALAPMTPLEERPTPPTSRSVTRGRLERLGYAVEHQAAARGADVEFLGVEPLFTEPRLYAETTSPWVLCPAASDPTVKAGLPIPRAQQRQLDAIVKAEMDFPHLYLAHELGRDSARPSKKPEFDTYRTLGEAETQRLLVRPDAPAPTRRTAKRLDQLARTIGRGAGLAAAGAAMAVAAPFVLLAEGLDPAVLGALTLPGDGHKPGAPAAWFLLARWDW